MIPGDEQQQVTDDELSAFADGQLSREASVRVAAHLRANPRDADRVHAYWAQEAELYRVFAAGLEGEAGERAAVPFSRRSGRTPLYVATAAAVLLALAAPWLLLDSSEPGVTLPAPQEQRAVTTYAGLELQPGGELQPEREFHPGGGLQPGRDALAVDGQFTEYRFSDSSGTVLVLYESAAEGAGQPLLEAGGARVEWVAQGSHYVLEGAQGPAELMSLAVSLRGQMAPSAPAPAGDMLAAPPAAQALQPLDEEVLPAGVGVSKM